MNSSANDVFGGVIKARRLEMGLTAKAVAKRIGIKRQTMTHYENHLLFPRDSVLRNLAGVLGLDVDELASLRAIAISSRDTYAEKDDDTVRIMCGDCEHWYPDLYRTEVSGGISVLMGTCELLDRRAEKCDFCLCGVG